MRLYCSGKMTGLPNNGFERFNEVAALLKDVGYDIDNPAEKGEIPGWDWNAYLKYDLHQVLDCDGVATLENWHQSRGARLEVRTAKAIGIPVHNYKYWLRKAALELFHHGEFVAGSSS